MLSQSYESIAPIKNSIPAVSKSMIVGTTTVHKYIPFGPEKHLDGVLKRVFSVIHVSMGYMH